MSVPNADRPLSGTTAIADPERHCRRNGITVQVMGTGTHRGTGETGDGHDTGHLVRRKRDAKNGRGGRVCTLCVRQPVNSASELYSRAFVVIGGFCLVLPSVSVVPPVGSVER